MLYSDSERAKLKEFLMACDEMIGGRFILSDIKISKILKSIADSDILYNLFSKCLINFNFKNEFKNAQSTTKINGGYFVLPNEPQKIIALVFCILLEVDNQKLNLQNFINENFFSPDGYNISYSNFSQNILIPFKVCVMNALKINANAEDVGEESEGPKFEQISLEQFEHTSNSKILFAKLAKAVNDLVGAVKKSNKIKKVIKEQVYILSKAMIEAILIENIKIMNAIMIAYECLIGKDKNIKIYYQDVKDCIINIYNL